MANNDILMKQLISKILDCPESSYENRKNLKKCQAFLRQYHPLEINPKFVDREMEKLCEKLDIYSLDHKSAAVKRISKKLLKSCDYSVDLDNYLMVYGIILFLLEINGSMVSSYEYIDAVEIDEISESQEINWGDILTKSEDIISLTRNDYASDESSDYLSETDEETTNPSTTNKKFENIDSNNALDTINYESIKSESWNKHELNNDCKANLQHEYWFDSFDSKPISKNISKTSSLHNSSFVESWEKFYHQTNPVDYLQEHRNRIEISEYQLIREVIDVLIGSYKSFIFKIDHDSKIITNNAIKVSKSVKLVNLSWKAIDNYLELFSRVATNCSIVRASCSYIVRSNSLIELPPAIVAFGERLHFYLNEFSNVMLELETAARGNVGLSLIELLNVVDRQWGDRLKLLSEIIVCISSDRFEALNCKTSVVTLLNLLYRLMNESCLVLTDPWVNACVLDLFNHTFKPYLYSLDALLSGQVHISPQNLFLTPKSDDQFHRNDIIGYWNSHFSFKKPTNAERLLNDIPVLLQLFIIQLISTIKAIDLLRILSIEMTKPGILNAIITEPGRFIENFNPTRDIEPTANIEIIQLYNYECHKGFILPQQHLVLKSICDSLMEKLSQTCKREIIDNCAAPKTGDDLMDACRNLHSNVFFNILDRYKSVNSHLVSVFVDTLGLKCSLNALKSIYFFHAGVEMYDFCSYIFDMVCNFSYDSPDLVLHFNLKLQQILLESISTDLRVEAHRFSVILSSDSSVDLDVGSSQTHLPLITIKYDAEWHLRLLITDEILSISNKCFRFLLQLKFAKYCLETKIHNERSANRSCSVLSNRMCSLRLKLLQIVNNFHVYVMNTFIVPSWESINSRIDQPLHHLEDFTDFISQITTPFQTMLRGCLQSHEMSTIEKAIRQVVFLGIEASQSDVGSKRLSVRELEEKYNRLIDFISAMFRSLAHLGISIGELDISAFK